MSMNNRPKPQQIYKHFKGNIYQIHCIAKDSETGEEMVVYQAMYGDFSYYVRPLAMFMSKVDRQKYPDVSQEYRFELVSGDTMQSQIVNMANSATGNETEEPEDEPFDDNNLDPDVLEFIDTDSYETRLEVLDRMKYKITDEMIDIMSTVIDIEIKEGPVEKRYADFKNAIETRRHFEGGRLRF